jgi:predicted transcriptional regulator of viral defense system
MNAGQGYSSLQRLGVPMARTNEVAAVWGVSTHAAAKMLLRLSRSGLVQRVRHGLWWIRPGPVDPFLLPEYLSAPYPSYISLQSALNLRGLTEQIPGSVYAVSLSRAQRVRTTAGEVSLHQIRPELFTGFETLASGIKLATSEKALFDMAYLAQSRIRSFASLPELELPRWLDRRRLGGWLRLVRPTPRRARVTARLLAWGAL